MADTVGHAKRVRRELQTAGVTPWGLMRFSIRYMPNVIDESEHIKAIIYGRYGVGESSGPWSWEEGTLVATNLRILFVDRKPGFLRIEHIAYSSVSGVDMLTAWPFSSVTLLSRVGNFSLRYIKIALADRFVNYVKGRSIAQP